MSAMHSGLLLITAHQQKACNECSHEQEFQQIRERKELTGTFGVGHAFRPASNHSPSTKKGKRKRGEKNKPLSNTQAPALELPQSGVPLYDKLAEGHPPL